MNIKRHIEMGSYRGLRHRRGLPFADSAPQPTRAPARVRAGAPWPRRRRANLWQNRSSEHPSARRPWWEEGRGQAEEEEVQEAGKARRPPRAGAHPGDVQQHHRHHHRPGGHSDRWSSAGGSASAARARARRSPRSRRRCRAATRRRRRPASGGSAGQRSGVGPRVGDPRAADDGIEVKSIKDVTPIPHNGCRPPKRRRVYTPQLRNATKTNSSWRWEMELGSSLGVGVVKLGITTRQK